MCDTGGFSFLLNTSRMIPLLNGCSRSPISVTPKNWDKKNAPMNIAWRIHYRFYMDGKSRQIVIKKMNKYITLKERQEATKALLVTEEHLLDIDSYNPITKSYMVSEVTGEVGPATRFFTALELAKGMLKIVPAMALDIKSMLKRLKACAVGLEDGTLQKKYGELAISQVKRKHLLYLLDRCQKDYPSMSNYRRNKYRTGLIMLFKKLLVLEAVDSNPALLLPIEKHVYKKRKLLTAAEFLIIDTNLKPTHYNFWRYFRIFFRSGSRSTELLTLKNGRNIDLERQEYTIIVKKGRTYREETRPIPVDVLELWVEVVNETEPGQYLFGAGFKPGAHPLAPEHVNRTWKKLVKVGMGIDKDFYSLKHLNADLIAERLGLGHAAAGTGLDESTARKHYTVNEHQRQIDRLKTVRLDF